jgi:nitrous oxidase accessory protein NosD
MSALDRRWALGAGAAIAGSLVLMGLLVNRHSLSAESATRGVGAPDFVVTSARDAGPGTLRDAILAADRLSTRARILITAKRILIESALPALVNPRGVELEAAAAAGVIDATHQETGAVLQINSPTSVITGLTVTHAHGFGIMVNAVGVRLESVTVNDSKVGVLVGAAAADCIVRTSQFANNDTGLLAEPDIHHLTILGTSFRANGRAGFWLVASAAAHGQMPADTERVRISDSVFEGNTSGVVVANQLIWVQKSRFIGNRESALLVLGGAAHLQDCEIHDSGGTAVSVNAGSGVVLARNRIFDNAATAISIRDSDVTVSGNTLTHNGLAIVSIVTQPQFVPLITDNIVTATTADAVTVIGGAPLLQRNTVTGSRGAALRQLDLVNGPRRFKATPRLEANVLKGNRIDAPVTGSYTLAAAP